MNKLNIHRCILFLSSYIPLYALLIIKDVVSRIEGYGLSCLKNFYTINSINDVMIIILFIISAVSFIYLNIMVKRIKPSTYILVGAIKNETSAHFLNYISIYLLSCMGLSISTFADITVLIFVMFIIGFIYIRSGMVYINPILNLMGYDIFSISGIIKGNEELIETILIASKKLNVKREDLIFTSKDNSFVFAKQKV